MQTAGSGLQSGASAAGMSYEIDTLPYLGLDTALVGREPDLEKACGVGGVVVHL